MGYQLVDDVDIVEGKSAHISLLIGKERYVVHIGVDLEGDYTYTIGYIQDGITDKEIDRVEAYIEENKVQIIEDIRKYVKNLV